MDEEALNHTIRKFLKTVGVTAQREIEIAVRTAIAEGRLRGDERLPAHAAISVSGLNLDFRIDGQIELE